MALMAENISAFGSRFNLILDPHGRRAFLSHFGAFEANPIRLALGVQAGGRTTLLPFTGTGRTFPHVEQSRTMTAVRFRAVDIARGIEFTACFRSPFYPKDERLSLAPFFYIDVEVKPVDSFRWVQAGRTLQRGKVVLSASGRALKTATDGKALRLDLREKVMGYEKNAPASAFAKLPDTWTVPSWIESASPGAHIARNRIEIPFDLSRQRTCRATFIWSAWWPGEALSVEGAPARLKYTRLFKNRRELVAYARRERKPIVERTEFFDSLIETTTLNRAARELIAQSFRSFLMDTWWAVTDRGRQWFSAWEGSCYFHSTIDVEYNNALVYFALWPELLGMLLDQWAGFGNPGETILGERGRGTRFLNHDMGRGVACDGQAYDHHMPVEENANFLLLLTAYWRWTGKAATIKRHGPLVKALAEFIMACDTTGNGLPDQGAANTIDDASPAIQYARDQSYLGVKAACALQAAGQMASALRRTGAARRYAAHAATAFRTIERGAWLGDHYAVCQKQTTKGLVDAWTGKPLPPGLVEGWDAYHLYTANGFLYPLMCADTTALKADRLRTDIRTTIEAAGGPYATRHASGDGRNFWISQNLWRDIIAAYLGVDLTEMAEGYWAWQLVGGASEPPTCFYDTWTSNNLCYYPRGITSIGLLQALAGLSVNRQRGRVELRPLRRPLRVPLLPFVDWKRCRAPWLVAQPGRKAFVSRPELLKGLTVRIHR